MLSQGVLNRALDSFVRAGLYCEWAGCWIREGQRGRSESGSANRGVGQCHKTFTDTISGKPRSRRRALQELTGYIREGDTVRVASMDRLGRDTRDLYNLVAEMTDKGAAVEFVAENITVDREGASPLDSLMLGILAAFAEFERTRIRERQAEGDCSC